MKIAIIGAGFTGLAAAYQLSKHGHEVVVYEKDSQPGGLAVGYQEKEWEWIIEKHYHHWFTNDRFVLNLAQEIGYEVITKRPRTSVYLDGKIYQLDSPLALLKFPQLSIVEKIRMGIVLAGLRYNPFWKQLETVHAVSFLQKTMGKRAFELLWGSQLRNKMGDYAEDVSLVWFWTRINKRTPSLAYPTKGFLPFATALVEAITKQGGKVIFDTEIQSLHDEDKVTITTTKDQRTTRETFDKVIVTLPSFLFLKLAPQLPESYKEKLVQLKGRGATNMVLRLKKQFLTDGTYWLSICDYPSPVMVLVEHTNLMDKAHYNNEHLLYIGNYPDPLSHTFQMSKEELLAYYHPFLEKIHPNYQEDLIGYELFKAPFAQPIVPVNYSRMIPEMKTPLPHVYLANIEQVYPWDRGTNYAVELGEKVANFITS